MMNFPPQSVSQALRSLRHSWRFSITVLLSLGFGIGTSTTVFSWMEGLVLRPLPQVRDMHQLVSVRPDSIGGPQAISFPEYRDWSNRTRTLTGVAAFALFQFGVEGSVEGSGVPPAPVFGMFASSGYFEVLGVRARLGRTFLPTEAGTAEAPVVVISDRFWRSRLGAEPEAVGRHLRVNGKVLTVVGIAPRGFGGTIGGATFDLWIPLNMRPALVPSSAWTLESRVGRWLDVFGRLSPDGSREVAEADFARISHELASEYPQNRSGGIRVVPLETGIGRQLGPLFGALIGITTLVVLIACSNVANLQLIRGNARARETAVRMSLGATRGRIIRQLMTENTFLALGGAWLGVLCAYWGRGLLAALLPEISVPITIDAPLDGRVLLFVTAISGLAALTFGLVPALTASSIAPVSALKAGTRGERATRRRVRAALVVGQFALSLAALACAGVFLQRAENLRRMDRGFTNAEHVLLLQTDLALTGYTDLSAWQRTLDRITEQVLTMPDVRAASLATFVPLGFVGYSRRDVRIEGYVPLPEESLRLLQNSVGPGYFDLMGIPLREGRPVTDQDGPGTPLVAVVNEAFVQRYWGGRGAIGNRIEVGGRELTVVGVAKDGKYEFTRMEEATPPLVYQAIRQAPNGFVTLHVRTDGNPMTLVPAVTTAIAAIDPFLPLIAPTTLEAYASIPFFPTRLGVVVLGALGAAALLLAAMGLYTVVSYGITLRSREIGIRLALGASQRDVLGLFLKDTVVLGLAGVAAGTVLAVGVTRLLSGLLTRLPQAEPASIILPGALLAVVALIAGFLPARRSTRIDPVVTLRAE